MAALLQVFLEDFYHRPAGYLAWTVSVLIAADVEPGIVFFREAIFAHIGRPPDFHDGAEFDMTRTRDGVVATAYVCAGGGRARIAVGLPGNRVVTRYIRPDFLVMRRCLGFTSRGQGKRQ